MLSRRTCTAGILLVALTGLPGGLARGEEAPPVKYRLKDAPSSVGDTSVEEKSLGMSMEMTVRVPDGDRSLGPLSMVYREREKYSETVLGMLKDQPTHVRRTYTIARVQSSNPGEEPTVKVYGRQGKTLALRQQNGKVTVTVAVGKIAAEELKKLKEEFAGDSNPHFFPDEEVTVGSEWTVDPKKLSTAFKDAERATMKAKLEEVAPFQGHPCARITMTMEIYGKFSDVPMLMQLTGEMRHAIDIQHTLSMKLSGPVAVKMEKTENGVPLAVEGKGTFDATWTRQLTKLARKPAPAQ